VFSRNGTIVSVEMGDGSIKIAELTSDGQKTIVSRLIYSPLARGSADEIRGLFESLNIASREVILNIPRHLVTVRFLKLPSTDDEEIRKMAGIESLRHVPYADEDTVSGCRIVEKRPDGYSAVLIAVTQTETVRKEAETLKEAGVAAVSASLGSEALLLWYLALRAKEEESTALLVNIDAGHIDIDIIEGKKLVFTRGVSYGAAGPIAAGKIIEQAGVSMAAYKKESGKSVDKIVLTGRFAQANELKPVIADRLGLPVEIIDQAAALPEGGKFRAELEAASFAELLGPALRREEASVNLLPEPAREERRIELVKKNIASAAVVLALIAAVAFGTLLKKFHDKRAYISYADAELAKIEPRVRQAKKMVREMDIIASKIAERPLAIDLVNETFRITPPGISLATMEYESHKTVTLRGTSPGLSDVFKFVTILEKSPYFENVKVKYANKRAGQAPEQADFEIVCPISKVK